MPGSPELHISLLRLCASLPGFLVQHCRNFDWFRPCVLPNILNLFLSVDEKDI